MAIPSTDNQPLVFVTRQPAWEREVTLEQGMATTIFTGRSNLEQRVQQSPRANFRLGYETVLNRSGWKLREERTAVEIRTKLVVPFWPRKRVTASTIVSNLVSISGKSTPDWFTPGDYIYLFHTSVGGYFRLIVDTGSSDQQLELEADLSSPVFPIGSAVYPCRFCLRDIGDGQFEGLSEDSVIEKLAFMTL